MTIYIVDGMAFVDLGKGYLLCIGKESEVKEADEQKITDMIRFAVAYSQWCSMESSSGETRH